MSVNDNYNSVLTYSETILFSVSIYLSKVDNKTNIRKRSELCPKLKEKGTRTMSIDMRTQLIDAALMSF